MATHGRKRRGEPERDRDDVKMDLGLGGIFKGLGSFIELLGEMAEKGETEATRTGEARGPGRTRAMYGFTVKIGASGAPQVERFGNVRDTRMGAVVEEVREPMVDVFDEDNEVVVVAEIPGVEANDLQLEVRDDILLLAASHGDRKYSKEVLLPCAVQPDTIKSSYHNGVAEIRLAKAAPKGA